MIVYGYAKSYRYAGDGTLNIQVRIPSIHGAFSQKAYGGKTARNYVKDDDLPYYNSVLLPHLPNDGEVVALVSSNDKNPDFLVVGLTGGSYYNGSNDI